jgi:hypothetical protein
VSGGKDIPHAGRRRPLKLFFVHYFSAPFATGVAATALSVLFSAMADWYRCVAASQPRYPTSLIDVSTNPQHTSIPPVQASNPSSIHPSMIRSLPHTAHDPVPLLFFAFLLWLFIFPLLRLSISFRCTVRAPVIVYQYPALVL